MEGLPLETGFNPALNGTAAARMVDTFFSFPFLSLLLGINWRLRIDNNIAVSKEEREEKGGHGREGD